MMINFLFYSIQNSLDGLDKLKVERQKVFEEAMQKCQNFNAIEELISIHQSQA